SRTSSTATTTPPTSSAWRGTIPTSAPTGGSPTRSSRSAISRTRCARRSNRSGARTWACEHRTFMNILVTGGAGFIGSNFTRYWVEQHPGDRVVVLDLLTYAGNRPNLDDVADRIAFVQGDIADFELAEQVLRAESIDVVVNFAAESHNSLAVLDPGLFFRTNVLGTQSLLEAARTVGIGRFHHISTCEVYGDLALDTDELFTETSPYRPRTPYNASKAG